MLNLSFPEIPRPSSALIIQKFIDPRKTISVQEEPNEQYRVYSAYSVRIAPFQLVKIHLGVCINEPVGTFATLEHDEGVYRNGWTTSDHRFDKDVTGEAMACIKNPTCEPLIVPEGTLLGKISILRIRNNAELGMSEMDINRVRYPADSKRLLDENDLMLNAIHGEYNKYLALRNANWRSLEERVLHARNKLCEIQNELIGIDKNTKVLQLNEPDGRSQTVRVGGRVVPVRGRRVLRKKSEFKHMDWVEPSCITERWTFIIPHSALTAKAANLWELDPTDWRLNIRGTQAGFRVRSVEEAVCITKLAYFDLGTSIPMINTLSTPDCIRRYTETVISKSKKHCNPDDPSWISYLRTAYTEAFAQWMNSLVDEDRARMVKKFDNFIVVDRAIEITTKESDVTRH